MKNFTIIGLLFLTMNLFSQEMTSLKKGDKFPDFELQTLEGTTINLESLKGKVVYINLWFTKCAPCIEEMPTLNDLQMAYMDKVEFLSITFDDSEEVKRFLSKHKFEFQHLINAKKFLNDELNNRTYPMNIIMDKTGTITFLMGSLPFTRNPETNEMSPVPYTFLEAPINKALAD